jgi:hypothetical protein
MEKNLGLAFVFFLAGCASTGNDTIPVVGEDISAAVKNQITICNTGYSTSLTAKLSVSISKNIEKGARADAGIEKELRGLLLNSDKITSTNIENVYDKYTACLQNAAEN